MELVVEMGEIAAEHRELPGPLDGRDADGPDGPVRTGAEREAVIDGSIGVEPDHAGVGPVVKRGETSAHQNLGVRLQDEGPDGPIRSGPDCEGGIELAVGEETGQPRALRSVVGAELPADQDPPEERAARRVKSH